jgi:GT2 family glycosyltransferase
MDISVIIVNFNTAAYLPDCLATLEKQLNNISHEICLVDNASGDGSVKLVRQRFPQVKVIENRENLGFSKAINIGLKNTTGRLVVWLNPDSEILTDAIPELIQYFDHHPQVGIVGAQLINSDGTIQLSCRSFPSYRTVLFNRYSLTTKLFPKNRFSKAYLYTDWDHNSVREVDWVSGACLAHRREVSEALQGPDERFFMYSEDVDFCLRAKQNGWCIHYHPTFKVLHHIGGSSKQVPYEMLIERHRSMWQYYAKHYRRNLVKDFIVRVAIWIRCWLIIIREIIKSWFLPSRSETVLNSSSDEVM